MRQTPLFDPSSPAGASGAPAPAGRADPAVSADLPSLAGAPAPAEAALFEPPPDRLARRLHQAVFGLLPTSVAHALDTPEVAAAVRPLLARGWRPAQLSARVGALPPPAGDPAPAVVAFLGQLLARTCPQEDWERERLERARAAQARAEAAVPPASDEVRAHWVAQARRSLGLPQRPRTPTTPSSPVRRCATCSGAAEFFVTREVRLCGACVQLLGSGRAHLAVSA